MSDQDISFIIGALMGLLAGYVTGHGRGYIAGVRWCTRRLDEPVDGVASPQGEKP